MVKKRYCLRLDRKDMDIGLNDLIGMGADHYLQHSAKASSYAATILGAVPDDLGLNKNGVGYTHKDISDFRFTRQSAL